MFWLRAAVAASLLALSACAETGITRYASIGAPEPRVAPAPVATVAQPAPSPGEVLLAEAATAQNRAFEKQYGEAPFARGPLAIVAPEGGDLYTWTLFPCRDRATVCAGSPRGPMGQVRETPDFIVVTGFGGRVFWLSYSGDGYVQRDGLFLPLTWNALVDGSSAGSNVALETNAYHGQLEIANRYAR